MHGHEIHFNVSGALLVESAASTCKEDADIAAQFQWSSSGDGVLGVGHQATTCTLSAGTHMITAAVTDTSGLTATASITLSVTPSHPRENQCTAALSNADFEDATSGGWEHGGQPDPIIAERREKLAEALKQRQAYLQTGSRVKGQDDPSHN